MEVPREFGVLIAGLITAAIGSVLICCCLWLDYRRILRKRQVLRERQAKLALLARANADRAQLVFEDRDRENHGVGVWGATPTTLEIASPV